MSGEDTGGPVQNTDRELWRDLNDELADAGDYYAPSVHVTEDGRLGINVGGRVFVLPLRSWHALAAAPTMSDTATARAEGYESAYVEVYEQHCRRVDPDLEGYSVGDLVSRLLTAVECELEGISPEVAEVMGRFTGRDA